MLVLSRNIGQSIVINGQIYITVTRIRGNQVSLAFDAPQSVSIHREEIHKKIQAEQEENVAQEAA